MRQKTKITKVYVSDQTKDGKKFLDKNNKPFWKVAIQTEATGKDYYSSLAFRDTDAVMKLKEGETHLFEFETKEGFLNFRLPSRLELLEEQVQWLVSVVNPLLADKQRGYPYPKSDGKVPFEEEATPEDRPF